MTSWLPDASVVVPVYNRAHLIGACIDSILASDYPADRLELIVVDNASTDDTPQVLRSYATRIRPLRETKRGPAATRNTGVRAARGEVVAFTDSDCIVDRAWLARLIQPLRDPRVGAAGGLNRALPEGNNVEHFGERIHDHAKAIHYFRPAYVITMNLAVRREILEKLGGFDERLLRCEDCDLAYRIEQAGLELEYVSDAVIYHHNRSTVPALLAEAYAHGFHVMKLDRLHRAYRRSRAADTPAEAPPSAQTLYSRPLAPHEEKLYWTLFRAANRLGKLIGYLRAAKLHDGV